MKAKEVSRGNGWK